MSKEINMYNIDTIVNKIKSKNKLTIGVDIDNVLFDTPIIEHINEVFDTKYTYEDQIDWDFTNFPEHIRQEAFAAFKTSEFMCSTKPYWNNYCTLRDWKLAGHTLYAITRRSVNLMSDTGRQLDRHFPNIFKDFIFVTPDDSKARWLKYVGADLHIDDYDVEDSVAAGIPTWLITNDKTKYNHKFRSNTDLYQATSLQHVRLDHTKWQS